MTRIVRGVVLLTFLLVVAACGDDADSAELPPAGDDAPPAAGACLEGTEDCNDTLFPGDEPVTPLPGDSQGMPIEGGGLTVAEALETDAAGVIAVTGFYVDTGSGPMLCDALAESFPPQCGGASIPLADISPVDPESIQTNQGTSWSDDPVFVVGEIVDGTLVPTPTSL
jgi:hypothetical protein